MGVTMGLMVGLVVAFVGALASVYGQTPAAAPLVIGLALGGVAVVSTAFEASGRDEQDGSVAVAGPPRTLVAGFSTHPPE